jgi:hypothetical protein
MNKTSLTDLEKKAKFHLGPFQLHMFEMQKEFELTSLARIKNLYLCWKMDLMLPLVLSLSQVCD